MTMNASRGAFVALGLALAVTIGGASYAQQRAPQPTPLPAPPQQNQVQPQRPNAGVPNVGPGRQFDQQTDRRGGRGDRLERRLDFLHYELRITQGQQRLWDQFADALRDQAELRRGRATSRNDRGQGGAGNALDRLEQRQDRLADRSERLDALVGTLRPLYTALNVEQKRTADRLLFQVRDRFNRGGFGRGRGGRGFDRGRFGGGFDRGQDRFSDNERDDGNFDQEYR